MTMNPIVALATCAAFASTAAGGMMYVFSTFVMRGLDRTDPATAITAMRGINAEADTNRAFLIAYFSATVLMLAVGVVAVRQWGQPGSGWLLAGAVLGILGAVITIAFNVPLNNRLNAAEAATLSAAAAARDWGAYLSSWTAWNHVRTVTAFVGAALVLIGVGHR